MAEIEPPSVRKVVVPAGTKQHRVSQIPSKLRRGTHCVTPPPNSMQKASIVVASWQIMEWPQLAGGDAACSIVVPGTLGGTNFSPTSVQPFFEASKPEDAKGSGCT